MMSLLNSRATRIVAGLAIASSLAVVPIAAQAADTTATGTLTAGSLSAAAPAITPFSTTLNGAAQVVNTNVGVWNFVDATESGLGYNVTVQASAPAVAGGAAGTGGSISMTPTALTAESGNVAVAPVAVGAGANLIGTPETLYTAVATSGQGRWNAAAGSGSLHVAIPSDARSGAYSSTLTFTTAGLAG
jgi:hypothetical protein